MKKIILIIFIALFVLVNICFATVSTTTVDKNNIPVATWFYMPIGSRTASIQNDLIVEDRSGYDTTKFPGYNGKNQDGWYVNTDFNTKYIYTGACYDIDPPTCTDYHPGEDWNGNGGGDSDEGQPVYAIGAGIVIGKGVGWGNMVFIVHRLSNDELIISVYAHLKNATLLNLGDKVIALTQIGKVGHTGTNPGIISPVFGPTVYADDVVIQFRAKVTGISPANPIKVYVKDQNNSWANSITLETISDSDYHYYVAYLSNITNASTKLVKQFRVELTDGSMDGYEYWEFDEVKVIYIGNPLPTSPSNFSDFKGTLQLNDMNGNGKDEIGILKRHSVTHQPTVTIYDSYTGIELTEIYSFDSRVVPQYVLKLPDTNSNSYPEIRVFGYKDYPLNTVSETRDGKSGTLIE